MSEISWIDEGLPADVLLDGMPERPIPAYVDDNPEVGAARRRKRFTRTLRQWPAISLIVRSRAALEDILAFYHVTTDGGVESFMFPAPVPQSSDDERELVEVRFMDGAPPIPEALSTDDFRITFGIEEV